MQKKKIFLAWWSIPRMCYLNTNNSFKFMDSYFAMKWYPFLCKITGKHSYSITTSQRFYPDNGRVVLKVSEINVIFYCHFIFKIFHLTQSRDYGELPLIAYCLSAGFWRLNWSFKSDDSFCPPSSNCINPSPKINGLSSTENSF